MRSPVGECPVVGLAECSFAAVCGSAAACPSACCLGDGCDGGLLGADLCAWDGCDGGLLGADLCAWDGCDGGLLGADLCAWDGCDAGLFGADLCSDPDFCGARPAEATAVRPRTTSNMENLCTVRFPRLLRFIAAPKSHFSQTHP